MQPASVKRLTAAGWKVYRIRCIKGTWLWQVQLARLDKEKCLLWQVDIDKLSSEAIAQINLDKLMELFPRAVQI